MAVSCARLLACSLLLEPQTRRAGRASRPRRGGPDTMAWRARVAEPRESREESANPAPCCGAPPARADCVTPHAMSSPGRRTSSSSASPFCNHVNRYDSRLRRAPYSRSIVSVHGPSRAERASCAMSSRAPSRNAVGLRCRVRWRVPPRDLAVRRLAHGGVGNGKPITSRLLESRCRRCIRPRLDLLPSPCPSSALLLRCTLILRPSSRSAARSIAAPPCPAGRCGRRHISRRSIP